MKTFLSVLSMVLITFNINLRAQNNRLIITDKEYFDSKTFSILVFHSNYPLGFQGYIEMIHHNNRIATNGNVVFVRRPLKDVKTGKPIKFSDPVIPVTNPKRVVDKINNSITIPFNYDNIKLKYHIEIKPLNETDFAIKVVLDAPVVDSLIESMAFEMLFYTEAYKGKSYITENGSGVFTTQFNGEVVKRGTGVSTVALAHGKKLIIAPEDPLLKMSIVSNAGEMKLTDNRYSTHEGWLRLSADIPVSKTGEALILSFHPSVVKKWVKPPVISYSQVGYHPAQEKKAVIELGKDNDGFSETKLLRLDSDGNYVTVFSQKPTPWGPFLRYEYGVFNFTSVTQPGNYRIAYGTELSLPFKIDNDIYKEGVWQPTLETFLPVQMCHLKIIDRGRIWHGVCHLDDALQVPSPFPLYDGYNQSIDGKTNIPPNTTFPGLNVGGWHDAGDDDLMMNSHILTIYEMALLMDEFNPQTDQTTIDFARREVRLHRPDGIPDVIQQIQNGVIWLLAQYRAIGHSVVGVISSQAEQYYSNADWGIFTDNLFYNPAMARDSSDGKYSGKFDDRYVFTDRDTPREYEIISCLASSSRILQPYDPKNASECFEVAQKIWNYETTHGPVFRRRGANRQTYFGPRTNAAVELYLCTKDKKYLSYLVTNSDSVFNEFERTAWTLSRVIEQIDNADFKKNYISNLDKYSENFKKRLITNPFGIVFDKQVWGLAWPVLRKSRENYYLIKKYPDLFPKEQLFNAVNYVLGCHPGSNISFVSGVGANQPIPAYGLTRSDYSYIPGGVFSGTNLSLPDFPELKPDYPYLWQQSEYQITMASSYMFCVLAAEKLLNK